MTVTRKQKRKAVKQKLIELIRDGNLGVRDLWFGGVGKSVPVYPMVHFMLTGNTQNEYQVQQPGKIGWDFEYEVTCIFAGTDDRTTTENLEDFTDSIYDILQGEHESGKRLDGEIQDIDDSYVLTFDMAAPESMVAIRVSCPGASTNDMDL